MRKAVIEVGKYTIREQPTGGWCVEVAGAPDDRISVHDTMPEALTAASRYVAADKRRVA